MTREMPLIGPLPFPVPIAEWVKVTDEVRRTKDYWPDIERAALDACRRAGWNPKTVPMGGKMVAIDYCFATGSRSVVTAYKVALIDDHPFLATLPANAPRAVKHIYRKEVRLRYLRADDGWGFAFDMRAAERAAETYNLAMIRAAEGTKA